MYARAKITLCMAARKVSFDRMTSCTIAMKIILAIVNTTAVLKCPVLVYLSSVNVCYCSSPVTELLETGMRLLKDPHILITRILARVYMGLCGARI